MNEELTYYSAVIAIVLITQITGLLIVHQNTNLNRSKRRGFTSTFALLIWATLLDWGTNTLLTLNAVYLIPLYKIAKCIELSIAPIILVECTFNVFSIKVSKFENLLSRIALTLHMILEFLAMPFNLVFGVTEDNVYYSGNFYWIYTVFLLIAASFLLFKVVEFCKYYQNQNIIVLILMVLITGIGAFAQFANSDIQLNWLTVTIAIIFLYVYYSNIAMHIDFLTKMLNQRSYNNELDSLNFPATIIIFDINDFKSINDTYGHKFGDEMISLVGNLIKNVFHDSGKCFRIGGDEFAVIRTKNLDSVDASLAELCACLNTKRTNDKRVPYVSYGYAMYANEYQQISDIVKEADKNMYENKKTQKSKND